MKEIYGTINLEKYSKEELLLKALGLVDGLLPVFQKEKTSDISSYEKVIELLEIIKFGKDRFPYLLTLSFENKSLTKTELWLDPYYKKEGDVSTAFTGGTFDLPDLVSLSKSPKLLKDVCVSLLNMPLVFDELNNTLCIAGSCESVLNIGKARESVFKIKNEGPIYSKEVKA